jgi:Zn-dependent protease
VARHFDMPIRGITLFIFGGVAEMHSEPTSAGGEFLMALAGPVASAALGFLLFLLFGIVAALQGPPAVAGILWYLSYLNWMLAIFNLLPAFPLDGGRMLRAALWGWRKDLAWATRIASGAGNVFGILLIVLGLIEVVRGDFVSGVWLSLIGLFLRGAASATYQQTLARQILGGQPVSRFMNRRPITVPPDLSTGSSSMTMSTATTTRSSQWCSMVGSSVASPRHRSVPSTESNGISAASPRSWSPAQRIILWHPRPTRWRR